MKKSRFFSQMLDMQTKILRAFIIVFALYFINKYVNDFSYNYVIFPLVSALVIFACGVDIGKSLEKIKKNKPIGFFTKKRKSEIKEPKTEFIINESVVRTTNKKILTDLEVGEQVHVKTFNYDDIYSKNIDKQEVKESNEDEKDRDNIIRL